MFADTGCLEDQFFLRLEDVECPFLVVWRNVVISSGNEFVVNQFKRAEYPC